MTLYYVPLASGYWKLFGRRTSPSGAARAPGSSRSPSSATASTSTTTHGVYVNLFIASELDWQEQRRAVAAGHALSARGHDAAHGALRAADAVRVARARAVLGPARRIGVAQRAGAGCLRGAEQLPGARPHVAGRRPCERDDARWRCTRMPMPDDGTVQAIMYGPLVLAGRLGTTGLTSDVLRAEPTKPRTVPEYGSDPVSAPSFAAAGANCPRGSRDARRGRAAGVSHRWAGDGRDVGAAQHGDRRAVRRVLEGRVAPDMTLEAGAVA